MNTAEHTHSDLREVLRRYVQDCAPLDTVTKWDATATYPSSFFDGLAELGFLGVHLPEEAGGGGLGAVAMAVVGEELGRGGLELAVSYGLTAFPSLTIARFGTPEQIENLIPASLAHRLRFAVGMSEPDAGSDVGAVRTRARKTAEGFVVSGQKLWTSGAGVPGTTMHALVRTSDGDKRSAFTVLLVPLDSDSIELQRLPTVGRHILGTYEVTFHDTFVAGTDVLGNVGNGWTVITASLEIERIFAAAELVGCAQTALDVIVKYVSQRKQFGQLVGNFQSVAHTLADLQARLQAARSLAYQAASRYDAGYPSSEVGSAAKLLCSELFQDITSAGMQFMGGNAYTTLFPMERLWREARSTTISAGTSEMQRNIIARHMGLLTKSHHRPAPTAEH
jgi:alkylation response protein AidB-like acyl-CoA dehydrogenase